MTYVGAASRLAPDAALRLCSAWAYQPKLDGVYAEVVTGPDGRIAAVTSRTGLPLREASDLIGIVAAPPRSVLVGELEAHTEAGVRAARARGWAALHLYDCLAVDGRSVAGERYESRHRWIGQCLAVVDASGRGLIETWREELAGPARGGHEQPAPVGRDLASGRYTKRIPRDLRRLPIVPLTRGRSAARELWQTYVERDGGEGIVAVNLHAPAGKRNSKRKVKLTDTGDCVVLDTSPGVLRLAAPRTSPAGWRGESFVVQYVHAASCLPGQVVEVAHDGWYENGTPRFPRVVRRREDKEAA